MPKKNPLPLSERIGVFYLDGVWNELPENKKTTVKARLVEWQGLAEALENGKALAEAEREIAASEAQNEALRQQNEALKSENQTLKSDNDILQPMVEKVNEEINGLRAERKHQQEQSAAQEKEIARLNTEIENWRKLLGKYMPGRKVPDAKPFPQFNNPANAVLYALAQEQIPITTYDLASRCGMPPAEVRHYIQRFSTDGLVNEVLDALGGISMGWRLSTNGDAYVVEKGLTQAPIGVSAVSVKIKPNPERDFRGLL